MNSLLQRVSIDPEICHGQPCIKGTRIMVWLIVEFLANGDGVDDVLAAYPDLEPEDVYAALTYSAAMTKEHVIPIEVLAAA